MATTILTNLGSSTAASIGSNFDLPGILTSGLKSAANKELRTFGQSIDGKIFGEQVKNTVKGRRLTDLAVQTSTYGDIIPIIFGMVKIAGNIIWAEPIKEIVVSTQVSGGGKGVPGISQPINRIETQFVYKATFAVSICEGEISGIDRVWADNKIINLADYCTSFTIYNGSETQLCDPLIEAFEGVGNTPAYRGLAYIVFEDFDLNSFGKRIPNLAFEVTRSVSLGLNGNDKVEDLITGINLIPGSGEFVYDTKVQTKIYGIQIDDKFIQRGGSQIVNMNNASNKADTLVSLDQLGKTFPNLEWVSVVCTWFADSLDANVATVTPRVEYKNNTTTIPDVWSVGSYTRDSTTQITLDVNGNPIYGGTPSDGSILRLIDELKDRGYKVLFYPMIFMDISDKPWRGRMTTSAANIPNFFTRSGGYNDFITHYANLVKDKVDAFLIGTEMKALTNVQAGDNSFPAVDEFVSLASTVKTIMGSSTKISYAADWSEYHSTNGWYHLDPLWASSNIDFIGIDAYFPLTDRPQDGVYDLQEVIDGWTSGEGYDWYYTDEDRTTKANLSPQYAWKNLDWWWNNTHTNPDNIQTDWTAQAKKIWFTEYGFPSVDGATNQPNVFYNPESSESALPYFSQGQNDFTAQRLGIEGTLLKWLNSTMVEEKILWCYDARPYPFWPDLADVWGDGIVWSKGHWVNGKLGGGNLAGIVSEICERCDLQGDDIDISGMQNIIQGYVLNNRISAKNALDQLIECEFFDYTEIDGKLKFSLNGTETEININESDLIKRSASNAAIEIEYTPESLLPSKIDLNFLNKENNYQLGASSDNRDSVLTNQIFENNIPVVLSSLQAQKVAETLLLQEWVKKKRLRFSLPVNYIGIDVGDVINVTKNNGDIEKVKVEKTSFNKNSIDIQASSFEKTIYQNLVTADYTSSGKTETSNFAVQSLVEILDIPAINLDDLNAPKLKFAIAGSNANWKGAEILYSALGDDYRSLGSIQASSVMGNVTTDILDTNLFIWDEINEIEVVLQSGGLQSVTADSVLNGSNLALIGDELIQFREAEFLSENTYKLTGILRARFGTEDKTTHSAGERFILLNELIFNADMPTNLIGQDIDLKIVSFGQDINLVDPITITYAAENLKPFSPVSVNADKATDNDINISWVRRSREGFIWRDFIDTPLNEAAEQYIVEIINVSDQVIRSIAVEGDEAYDYTEAEQIADFGSSQSSVEIRLSQLSQTAGKGHETDKTFNF